MHKCWKCGGEMLSTGERDRTLEMLYACDKCGMRSPVSIVNRHTRNANR